jgi:hypothetical protein
MALFLLCANESAAGSVNGSMSQGYGFATKDGGAIQQCYVSARRLLNLRLERPDDSAQPLV